MTSNNGPYPELGLIRRLQVASAGDDPDVQRLQALSEMAQFGAPMRTIEVTVFDNPATRRGDTVVLKGFNGVDDGGYHLVGVQHMPAQRQMRLQLDSSGMFDHRRKSFDLFGQSLPGHSDPKTTQPSNGDTSSQPPADASSPPPNPQTRGGQFLNPATGNWSWIQGPLNSSPFSLERDGQTSTFRVISPSTVQVQIDRSWLPYTMTGPTVWPELDAAARQHGYTGKTNTDGGGADPLQNPNPPRP